MQLVLHCADARDKFSKWLGVENSWGTVVEELILKEVSHQTWFRPFNLVIVQSNITCTERKLRGAN